MFASLRGQPYAILVLFFTTIKKLKNRKIYKRVLILQSNMENSNRPSAIAFRGYSQIDENPVDYAVVLAGSPGVLGQQIFYRHGSIVGVTCPIGNRADFGRSLERQLDRDITSNKQVRIDDLGNSVGAVTRGKTYMDSQGLILIAPDQNGTPKLHRATTRKGNYNVHGGTEGLLMAYSGVNPEEFQAFLKEQSSRGNIDGLVAKLGVALRLGSEYLAKFAGENEPQFGMIYSGKDSRRVKGVTSYPNLGLFASDRYRQDHLDRIHLVEKGVSAHRKVKLAEKFAEEFNELLAELSNPMRSEIAEEEVKKFLFAKSLEFA